MKQKLAWAGIIAIIAAFLALVYFTATGASANVIMAMLFCMIIVPVFIYALLMVMKLTKPNDETSEQEKNNRDK